MGDTPVHQSYKENKSNRHWRVGMNLECNPVSVSLVLMGVNDCGNYGSGGTDGKNISYCGMQIRTEINLLDQFIYSLQFPDF